MPKPNERKLQLIDTALSIAKKRGYTKVTREAIAAESKVSPALLTHYFGTTANLRRDIMRAAVSKGIVEVVAQGLADGNPHAKKAPDELKKRAAAHLVG